MADVPRFDVEQAHKRTADDGDDDNRRVLWLGDTEMSPVIFLVVGLILIWLVFTRRATNVWNALTNNQPVAWSGGNGASGGGERGFN